MFSSGSCRLLGVAFRSIIHFELIFKIYLIYLFLAVLGLHCHMDVPLGLASRGYLGFVTSVASCVAEHGSGAHGLQQLGHMNSVVAALRLPHRHNSCGTRA